MRDSADSLVRRLASVRKPIWLWVYGHRSGHPPSGGVQVRRSYLLPLVSGALVLGMVLGCLTGGCATGPTVQEARQSMRQYELAVGLRDEGNTAGSFRALYKALELDPDNAHAHLLLGKMFLIRRQEDPAENDARAEKHLRHVLRIEKRSGGDDPENLAAEARNDLGVLYIHQERYDAATRQLRAAAEDLFNRQKHFAWGNLGWAYYLQGDYQKAVDALSKSVELHRRFCVGYFRLGQTYMALRDFERAENALTHALEADERCERLQHAWRSRGEARANLGRRDEAISDFERCVELGAQTEPGKACSRYLEATH